MRWLGFHSTLLLAVRFVFLSFPIFVIHDFLGNILFDRLTLPDSLKAIFFSLNPDEAILDVMPPSLVEMDKRTADVDRVGYLFLDYFR